MPSEKRVGLDDRGHFLQGLLPQPLANLGQDLAIAIAQAYATFDLVTKHAIFSHEVLIAQQQFLIDASRDVRQQVFPVHRLPPQPWPSIWTLSMGESGAEDKLKRRRW